MKLAASHRRFSAALISAAGLLLMSTALVAPAAHAVVAPNDNFANATVLNGVSAEGFGDNTSATTETGEPVTTSLGHGLGHTLWWRWTAPITASFALTTAGSLAPPVTNGDQHPPMDTTLSVFTGSSVNALSLVATDDDTAGVNDSAALGFAATAGTTYYFQVGGFNAVTGTIRLAIGAADVTGSFTYNSPAGAPPRSGCITFYTDNTFSQAVVGGCGTGTAGGTTPYAIGFIPAGTYFMEAQDGSGAPTFYPGGTTTATAGSITFPGGGCMLTGLNVNLANATWTAPSGKTCPFAPACQSATGSSSQASAAVAAATAAQSSPKARVAADQIVISKVKKLIKKSKKKHKPTGALVKKLAKVTAQLKVDAATLAADTTALNTANANLAAAQAKVTGSC